MVQRRADIQQVIADAILAADFVVVVWVCTKLLPCFEAKPLCERLCCQLPNGLVTHRAPNACICVASAY